jgi:hypothetical protein
LPAASQTQITISYDGKRFVVLRNCEVKFKFLAFEQLNALLELIQEAAADRAAFFDTN